MATWLYQIREDLWSPERFRLEIWEDARWTWRARKVAAKGGTPKPGDVVTFFYAKSGATDPGFYGWAIVTEWHQQPDGEVWLYFLPVAPTNLLKMSPWADDKAMALAKEIRGPVPRGTLWLVEPKLYHALRSGILAWVYGQKAAGSR